MTSDLMSDLQEIMDETETAAENVNDFCHSNFLNPPISGDELYRTLKDLSERLIPISDEEGIGLIAHRLGMLISELIGYVTTAISHFDHLQEMAGDCEDVRTKVQEVRQNLGVK